MNQFNSEKLIFWRWSGIFVSLPIVSLSFSCQTYDPILNPFFSVLCDVLIDCLYLLFSIDRMLFVVFSELSDSTSHAMNDIIDLSVSLVGFIYFVVREINEGLWSDSDANLSSPVYSVILSFHQPMMLFRAILCKYSRKISVNKSFSGVFYSTALRAFHLWSIQPVGVFTHCIMIRFDS